ncbi:MAG: nitroreductase/quinone reductase family protein [Pseudomonadota bacterium]
MRLLLKIVTGLLAFYAAFVVVFEAGYLGWAQPSFAGNGIPMMVLTTTDDAGDARSRMLAQFNTDGALYASAHHWPRGWYRRALQHPAVQVEIDGVVADYRAVSITGSEFERVAAAHPLPFMVRFLMGFPPEREILRLDPATPRPS